jgi:hypothetical protein
MDEEDVATGLMEFAKKMIAAQEPLDPEFARIFHDNKWNLCE